MTKLVKLTCQYNGTKYHSASTETITVPQTWYDYAVKFDELEDARDHATDDDVYIAAEYAYMEHAENAPVEHSSKEFDEFQEFLDAFWAANDYTAEVI